MPVIRGRMPVARTGFACPSVLVSGQGYSPRTGDELLSRVQPASVRSPLTAVVQRNGSGRCPTARSWSSSVVASQGVASPGNGSAAPRVDMDGTRNPARAVQVGHPGRRNPPPDTAPLRRCAHHVTLSLHGTTCCANWFRLVRTSTRRSHAPIVRMIGRPVRQICRARTLCAIGDGTSRRAERAERFT